MHSRKNKTFLVLVVTKFRPHDVGYFAMSPQSLYPQRNPKNITEILLMNEQLFITEPSLISAYPPRYAICLIIILIVCITFSRCLVEIDRWATGCLIGTLLLIQTESIL